MRNFHQYGIDTKGRNSGKIKTICPSVTTPADTKETNRFPST